MDVLHQWAGTRDRRHSHGGTGFVIIDVLTGCGERKDRVSGIPIVQLFSHWGIPSFEGGLVCGDCRRRSMVLNRGAKEQCRFQKSKKLLELLMPITRRPT